MTNYSEPLVRLSGGHRLITTSLAVSHHFSKKHKHVLEAIKELDCSHEFGKRNFTLTSYTTSQGKKLPSYEITRDGFMFLCMGFTGSGAAKWKAKYITAFNAMEKQIYADQATLAKLQAENQALKQQVITHNPRWSKIVHYKRLGLSNCEVARLMQCADSTIGRNLRRMNQLNLLAEQQQLEMGV